MNQPINQDFNNKINLYKNVNIQVEAQRKNYKMIKEYYKNKSNMVNYLKSKVCTDFMENFEILNYISSGSSGVVYEGRYLKKPEKHVCLKFLLNKSEEEKREKKNKSINININTNTNIYSKIKEINIQNKLKDKNITEYYDYCDLKDYGCIIMEFAKFGDLEYFQKKLIKKNSLSETLLAYITKQILDGLLYIHQSKIIHMDIKQQNILIDEKLNVKITDFSVSFSYEKYKENDKINLPLSGTSLYMSPEVLLKSQIDYEDCCKIDIFSLGVVLFNLAFEKFPYELDYSYKRNFALILDKIKKQKLIIPEKKKFSVLFKKFLKNLLEKNIKNRISIYEALEDPWIKGADLLIKEKEKLNDIEKFLINMITDNVRSFNDYLKNNNSDTFHTSN
jgi:serine/threonine protein kinase